ncbi:MAG: site-specific tyrosine recombinase XerC [Syntrophorhabdus sp. PtaU1.Bin058]|nr:MAG: site-specific tyrosine recombinase XerC [Syntrophorhabdus sp. PtaU1.Bin058]
MERGSILCAAHSCGKVRSDHDKSCPFCGHDNVYIRIIWKGKPYRYYLFRDNKQRLLPYSNAQAIIILREINSKIDSGTFDPEYYLTKAMQDRLFENAYEAWIDKKLKLVRKEERAPETVRCYESYARNYLIPFFEGVDVGQITEGTLEDFLDDLPEHLSQKYRKNIVKCLEAFLRWCVKKRFAQALPEIPAVVVKSARKMRAIPYEMQIFGINNLPEEHRDIFLFARETALRISEACVIKASDINIASRQALICRNVSGAKVQNTTKGGEAKPIPLSQVAVEIVLRNVRDLNGYIFINPVTRRNYMPEFLRRLWNTHSGTGVMLKEAMRHSTLSDWANARANAFQIKDLGRHSDIRTSNIYVHNAMEGLYDIFDIFTYHNLNVNHSLFHLTICK